MIITNEEEQAIRNILDTNYSGIAEFGQVLDMINANQEGSLADTIRVRTHAYAETMGWKWNATDSCFMRLDYTGSPPYFGAKVITGNEYNDLRNGAMQAFVGLFLAE
jgi:hypothetical protein